MKKKKKKKKNKKKKVKLKMTKMMVEDLSCPTMKCINNIIIQLKKIGKKNKKIRET